MTTAWDPPRHLLAPHTANTVATVIAAVALVLFVAWSCRDWLRDRDALGPFVIIGGSLAAIQEPIADTLGHIWVRPGTQMFETLGRAIPIWAVLAYGGFFGAMTYLLYRRGRAGADRRSLRRFVVAILAINVLLEPLLIKAHLYDYYGDQPLRIFDYPVFWPFVNVTGIVLSAMVLLWQRERLAGWRAAFALVLVPVAVAGGTVMSGLPVIAALNGNGVPGAVLVAAAFGTIAFAVLIMEGALELGVPGKSAAHASRSPVLAESPGVLR